MKINSTLAAALLLFAALGATASAAERKASNRMGARGPAKLQPTAGLQTSGSLATGSINGSGADAAVERLSDDQWRKLFPVKKPEGQPQ